MYRSILVPLDGSAAAEHALPTALSLARRLGATLQVVHVHVPLGGAYGEVGRYDETFDRDMHERGQAYVDEIIKRLSAVTDLPLSSALLEGAVASVINQHAVAAGVDLVVMTTHGRGPIARFWLGSVSDARSLIVQTRVVSEVPPANAILEDARANGADLIALATQGRGGLKRLFLGSVAGKVLRGATTPVLVYRPVGEFASPKE